VVIYGVALLSVCMLVGVFVGDVLGDLIGVQANVGLSNLSHHQFHLSAPTEKGVNFWSAMYIPIVVAMAAKQNVIAAISSGWMAIIAGVAAVAVSFAMIPLLDKIHIGEGGADDS
jgi:malonate transporter MadL subunit